MSVETILIPQRISHVVRKAAVIMLEVMLVPAAIVASLGGAGQVTLGIMAVFAWRIIAAAVRWGMVGLLPATSILTFALLSARTGTAAASDTIGLGSTLQTYLLPACIISFCTGLYFVITSTGQKPLTLKLAKDFINLPPTSSEKLLPVFKVVDFIIGGLHVLSAIAGAYVVFTTEERQAAIVTSGIGVATPLLTVILSIVVGLFFLRRAQLKVSFSSKVMAGS